jgi:flavin-dependent dehydrogenase
VPSLDVNSSQLIKYAVIIVGGGPAGCALALSLSQCAPELSFILVSDAIPSNFKIGESLPPEAKRLLHHLHPSLLKRFLEDEKKQLHLPSDGTASAWGSQEVEERHSILNPFGHGWHLDRAAFDETMRSVLQELRGGNCLKLGRFSGVRKEDGHWKVDISQSDSCNSYSANWIVDATGRKASVAAKVCRCRTHVPSGTHLSDS